MLLLLFLRSVIQYRLCLKVPYGSSPRAPTQVGCHRHIIYNPNGHLLTVNAIIEDINLEISDTLSLVDDGVHGDSSANDNIFGGYWPVKSGHGYFNVSINAHPIESGYLNNYLYDGAQFTTSGPVVMDDLSVTTNDTVPNPGDQIIFTINVRNESLTDTVFNIKAMPISLDTCASVIAFSAPRYGDIAPGEIAEPDRGFRVQFDEDCPEKSNVKFGLNIYSDGYLFWSDTFSVYVDVSSVGFNESGIPLFYALDNNYPNPFNPSTTIGYQLPFVSDVELSIYNVLGQKVATLVSKQHPVGYYQVDWDAADFASGIYYYRIVAIATQSKNEEPFIQTKKLILVR